MNKSYCSVPNGEKLLKKSNVRLIYKDPRLLVVRLTTTEFDNFVYVVHAPHERHESISYADWWANMQEMMSRWPPAI
eukprot:5748949-Pyramimonas_sp.AAC.1